MSGNLDSRAVAPTDLDLICRHREAMFREAGWADATLATMAGPFREWLAPRLSDGRYFGFVVEDQGRAVAGVGLMEIDWPPHPTHPSDDRRGYVLNLFVERSHRGQGIARRLLEASDREFARRGVSFAVLHATDMGRPLYDRTGWKPTTEMAKVL